MNKVIEVKDMPKELFVANEVEKTSYVGYYQAVDNEQRGWVSASTVTPQEALDALDELAEAAYSGNMSASRSIYLTDKIRRLLEERAGV